MQSESDKPRFQYRHLPEYEWAIVDTSNGDKIVKRISGELPDVRSLCTRMNEHIRDFLRKSLGLVWNNGFRYGMFNNI